MSDSSDIPSIAERLTNVDADIFRFETLDFFGRSQTVAVPRSKVVNVATDGIEFPVRAVFKESDEDTGSELVNKICYIRADATSAILRHPTDRSIAFIFAEPHIDGSPMTSYPRFVARKQLSRLTEIGYTLKSSFHLQFSLKSNRDVDGLCKRGRLVSHFLSVLDRLGTDFEVENLHMGTMANCIDGTYQEVMGIKGADYAQYFKFFINESASDYLYDVSFLEKQIQGQAGNLFLRFRHSLWDVKGKKDLTYDPDSPVGLSEVAQHWMAGILKHMPAITRFTFPSQSCWEMNKGEKPNDRWQLDSPGSSLRLHSGGEGKTFVETRQGTGRCNPYLLMAAVVAAGIDGMEKKLPLPEAGVDSGKEVPCDLQKATEEFEADEVLMTAFGGGKDFIQLLKSSLSFL